MVIRTCVHVFILFIINAYKIQADGLSIHVQDQLLTLHGAVVWDIPATNTLEDSKKVWHLHYTNLEGV